MLQRVCSKRLKVLVGPGAWRPAASHGEPVRQRKPHIRHQGELVGRGRRGRLEVASVQQGHQRPRESSCISLIRSWPQGIGPRAKCGPLIGRKPDEERRIEDV
eukprot:13158659-Alexandrium_andersonii.AAC.1